MRKRYKMIVAVTAVCVISFGWIGAHAEASGTLSADEYYQRILNSQGNSNRNTEEAREALQESFEEILQNGGMTLESDVTVVSSEGIEPVAEEVSPEGADLAPTPEPTPTVMNVAMTERYYSDFDQYELSIRDMFFLYANVSNGEITDKTVVIDIPANISYSMEKDGKRISYSSGESVSEEGSYVLNVEVTEDDTLPVGEQRIYRAVFRFRIQQRQDSSDAQSGNSGQESDTSSDANGGLTDEDVENMDLSDLDLSDLDLSDSEVDQIIADATVDDYGAGATEGYIDSVGMGIAYDEDYGYYRYSLASGAMFYANVPNGMITNGQVTINTTDAIIFTVYRNGELIEYEAGQPITQSGSYTVYPSQEGTIYVATYSTLKEPVFHFRILDQFVNDIGIYVAPWNSVIVEVELDGELLPEESFTSEYCYLEKDGSYRITLQTPAGMPQITFKRDTVAPRFYVNTSKNRADFYYRTADLARYELYQDNVFKETGNVLNTIEEPGNYSVYVYDTAGNMSSISLNIKYGLNTASVVFIVLVIALVIALIVFIHHTRRTFVIR